MATLQEKHVNFNSKMVVNNTGGNLSTDSGLILVKEFMDPIGFSKLARQFLTFQDNRSYWLHDNISLLEQLLFRHKYLITNCSEELSPRIVFQLYHNRGTMENFIKEAKNGFYFDKTDSSFFLENHARMMVSLLAYNLVNFMKSICLPPSEAVFQVDTLRLRLFKVARKLVKSGRRLFLKLSSSHAYQQSFSHLLQKIQQLAW